MAEYLPGHVKRDPDTGEVAIRTVFPEDDFPNQAWLVATSNVGARNEPTSDVEGWDDLFTPPPDEPADQPA